MKNAFSPFHDKQPNVVEKKYLETLRFHHENFINFSKKVFENNKINSAIEVGSYLTNVAIELKTFCVYFVATEVKTKSNRKNYNLWARKNGVNTAFNQISSNGLKFIGLKKKKFDALIISEVMEHLAYNPFTITSSFKKYLSNDGVVIVSVPNRMSINKIVRFFKNQHPYIFFNDFISNDEILKNYGHHWLEYSLDDLTFVFKKTGFSRKSLLKKNINYGSKIKFFIKNLMTFLSFGLIYDQIYCEFKVVNN